MKVTIEKNGSVTIDFEGDLLVTSHKHITVKNPANKILTICNADIIGSRICGIKTPLRNYIINCIKGCFKRYAK